MFRKHLFVIVIVAALLVMAGLVAYQAVAVAKVAPATQNLSLDSSGQNPETMCPFTAEQIRSIHSVYINDSGIRLPFTSQGPTGVDGGLSALRYCSNPGNK